MPSSSIFVLGPSSVSSPFKEDGKSSAFNSFKLNKSKTILEIPSRFRFSLKKNQVSLRAKGRQGMEHGLSQVIGLKKISANGPFSSHFFVIIIVANKVIRLIRRSVFL